MLLNKISKFHLIHFAIVFVLSYLYSHDITFNDHRYYNIKFFFIIFIPILIILIISKYCLSIKKIVVVFVFLSIYIFLNYFPKDIFDCKDWVKVLNNTSIDNNEKDNGRRIKIPKSCSYKIGKYFFDRYKISSPDCYKRYKRALQSRKYC